MKIEVPARAKQLYTTDARYIGLKGGRSSGKSWAVADYILFRMVNDPDLFVVCVREIQKSIAKSSKKLLEDRIIYHKLQGHFEVLHNEIRCKLGKGEIIFQGLQDSTADSIKSLEGADLAWTEEAQTITQHSLDLLVPTIRKDDSKLLFTWNPRNRTDAIERLFQEKKNSVVMTMNYLDNPFCSEVIVTEAEEMRADNPDKYAHVYLGGYVDTTGNKLFSYKDLDRAMTRPGKASGATIIGADIARYGDDSSVLVVRSGLWVKSLLKRDKLSVTETADWANHIYNISGADGIIVDTIGIGAGVHDILMQKGVFSVDGNFGFKASDENTYINKRAECYFRLADAVKRGLSLPENHELMEELLAIGYEFRENGRVKIVSKDKLKEELGRSPDLADALALTYFTDIMPSSAKESMQVYDETYAPNLF